MIEKYYIVENEDFLKKVRFFEKARKDRNQLIVEFFKEHGIDGDSYYFSGDGYVNEPFSEEEKRKICLSIDLTEKNERNFGNQLKKNPCRNGLYSFKKSSPVLKAFQDICIERQVIISLWDHFIGDYFLELHFGGFSSEFFENNGVTYLKVVTSRHGSITPQNKGFTEIKASEYFKTLEELEGEENE